MRHAGQIEVRTQVDTGGSIESETHSAHSDFDWLFAAAEGFENRFTSELLSCLKPSLLTLLEVEHRGQGHEYTVPAYRPEGVGG